MVRKLPTNIGMKVTMVASSTTIQREYFSRSLVKMLDRAEPAAIRLTALAVIDVKMMTKRATTPRPSLLAIVDGSELLAS